MHEDTKSYNEGHNRVEITRITKRERVAIGSQVTIQKLENGYTVTAAGRQYVASEVGVALDTALTVLCDDVDIAPPGTVFGLRDQLVQQANGHAQDMERLRGAYGRQIDDLNAKISKLELAGTAKKTTSRKR